MGSVTAPLTMVEFSDFECPYCSMFRTETFPRIKSKYVDSGQLRFVHRHLPLPAHKNAKAAAHAALCAGDQGRYWALSELMFSRATCLSCQGVMELSKNVDLDRKAFEVCMAPGRYRDRIEADMQSAKELKIEGTPGFILGRATSGRLEGVILSGSLPYEQFEKQIDAALRVGGAATNP